MNARYSLRARLTAVILAPLLLVVCAIGIWQVGIARETANDVFDRNLLTVALAVANDVAVSEGDALSPATSSLLENSSGGPVFYHVYAPDGVIVAGYATPPVGIPIERREISQPRTFDATYLGRDVSGLRLQTQTEIDGFSGIFTTTVWQDRSLRSEFVRDLMVRTFLGLGAVLASVAVIVWFGVRIGLRPLNDLQDAIEQRSSNELPEIRRAVPEEVQGIVQTLNSLFQQVRDTMSAQSQFIANAAHQLRNPIAAVLALAEAVDRAKSAEDMRKRSEDLLEAARKTSALTQRLLLHERASSISPTASFTDFEAQMFFEDWFAEWTAKMPSDITLETALDVEGVQLRADKVMLREALSNLVDNALVHGGKTLSKIDCVVGVKDASLVVQISDNGKGMAKEDLQVALRRFAQVGTSEGSGLGLAITQEIVTAHGGVFELGGNQIGLRAEMALPIVQ